MQRVVGICVVLIVLHTINENQNLLLKLACSKFTIVITDGRHESHPRTFGHYNYDVVRALHTLHNVSLSKTSLSCSSKLRRLKCDRFEEFSGFVNSSIAYLERLKSDAPLRVSIITNVRHHLSDPNAPGNFLRLARFVYDPSMSAHINASLCRQTISQEKQNKRRSSIVSLLRTFMWSNVVINCWSLRDDIRYIQTENSTMVDDRRWNGRKRSVVLSPNCDTWYIRREQYV
jgi:hypothetical protein